jgi:hypothetical protein
MEEQFAIWKVAMNIRNKQARVADNGCSSGLGFGREANKSSRYKKNGAVKQPNSKPQTWTDNQYYDGSAGIGMWGYGLDRYGSG